LKGKRKERQMSSASPDMKSKVRRINKNTEQAQQKSKPTKADGNLQRKKEANRDKCPKRRKESPHRKSQNQRIHSRKANEF
jgi:hypothetical protein